MLPKNFPGRVNGRRLVARDALAHRISAIRAARQTPPKHMLDEMEALDGPKGSIISLEAARAKRTKKDRSARGRISRA